MQKNKPAKLLKTTTQASAINIQKYPKMQKDKKNAKKHFVLVISKSIFTKVI